MTRLIVATSLLSLLVSATALYLALSERRVAAPPAYVSQLERRLDQLTEELAKTTQAAGAVTGRVARDDGEVVGGSLEERLAHLEAQLQLVQVARSRERAQDALSGSETERLLENARDEELRGRLERWAAREEERCEKTIASAVEKLGLNWAQGERVAQCLQAENEQRRHLLTDLWGEAGKALDDEGYRSAEDKWNHALEQMKEARRQRDVELRSFLSEEQFEQLQQLSKDASKGTPPL